MGSIVFGGLARLGSRHLEEKSPANEGIESGQCLQIARQLRSFHDPGLLVWRGFEVWVQGEGSTAGGSHAT